MSARTDALVSQQETGKIAASIVRRCGRLPPSMSCRFNAHGANMFPKEAPIPPCRTGHRNKFTGKDTKLAAMRAWYCRPAFRRRNRCVAYPDASRTSPRRLGTFARAFCS